MIRNFFKPPVFDNEEQNTKAKFLNGISWIVIGLVLIAIPFIAIAQYEDFTLLVLIGIIAVFAIVLFLLRRGYLNFGAILIAVTISLFMSFQALTADGVRDVILIGFLAIAMLASLTINIHAGVAVLIFGVGVIWTNALLETNNIIKPTLDSPINYARDLSIMFVVVAALIYFVMGTLRRSLDQTRTAIQDAAKTNEELDSLRISLEQRIEERTKELDQANRRNERRAKQFEAIAQVAHATAANESLDTLLPRLASLVSEQFGFYHTGVFLIDDKREYAVLRAANSEGGKQMLQRGHKLLIGQTGIVGFVSAMGTPRIALDVGVDAVFFDNPDLPSTRSEMALPLHVSGEIIGVLDVQSTRANEFQEEDIGILSTLADQVAVAIQNARTYQTMQDLLEEAQRESNAYIRDSWRTLQAEESTIGYRVAGNEIASLIAPLKSNLIERAVKNKQTVRENGDAGTMVLPIRLRNEVIAIMDIHPPAGHEWDEDEIDIIEAVADRLSLALESSMLLKATQRQAEIERITTDISGKISSATQFDAILRTAAEELSRVLGGSEVLVQLHQVKNNVED